MKRLFSFILAVIYLVTTAGTTIHLHYCMDQLVNWSLSGSEGDECGTCGMEKDGNCCKDENKFVKNNSDQSLTGAIQLYQSPATGIGISIIDTTEDHVLSFANKLPGSLAPLVLSGTDILIHNCIFRI